MSAAIPNHPPTRKKMSAFQQAILSFYWFATNAHWTAIMLVLMPSQVKSAVGEMSKAVCWV